MPSPYVCLVAASLAASITLASAAAVAQVAPDDPREAVGQSLRAQGRDAEALDVFREVYARTRSTRALARVALAEAALGRWLDAEPHLVEALASSDPWVTANRREPAGGLEGALALIRTHLGNLVVRSGTPGAELWIAGVRRAALPLEHPLRVTEGSLSVELRAPGHLATVRPVAIRGGVEAPVSVDIELDRVPDPQRSVAEGSQGRRLPPPRGAEGGQDRRAAPSRLRPFGIAALGVGAAGLALGVGAYLAGRGAVTDFTDANCYATGGGYAWEPSQSGHGSQSQCESLGSSAETWRAVELTGFVAGGLFAAAGIALLAWPEARAQQAHATLSCGPSGRGVGIACGGTF